MRVSPSRTLGAASVGVSLATIHYGMGFILSTSEKSFIYGGVCTYLLEGIASYMDATGRTVRRLH